MLPKKITLLYSCSVLILVAYTLLLIFNYAILPETIAIHRDISGTIDGYGNKTYVWLTVVLNLALLLFIYYIIRNPKYTNFPMALTPENKAIAFYKMQLFLVLISILFSIIIGLEVLDVLGYSIPKEVYATACVLVPVCFLMIFSYASKSKSKSSVEQ
ncbi:DUF1648 domain-containing protein [Flavobacterium kingsejongi]|uniref:DUF1648 domain-containing protein n=1 Tax=Flavobacterium kingsejongi TaxID=1678728 RepID=A0A2S1LR95_9FLAO|nr:DUF1648 domain-containing protein [Flavobacterium kingsejongi]AWG26249.1 hypothetical protein FK004_13930 [Flavobacterium kingsejongi]